MFYCDKNNFPLDFTQNGKVLSGSEYVLANSITHKHNSVHVKIL